MSSTSSIRSTTPTPSTSNRPLDLALDKYRKHTGKDLLSHPQVADIDRCESPDSMLSLFRNQSRAFDEFSNGDPELIKWLTSIVLILGAIGEALGAGATLVSPTRFHIQSPTYVNATSRHAPLKDMSYMELAPFSPCVSLSPFPASS